MTRKTCISSLVEASEAISLKLDLVKLDIDEAAAALALMIGPDRASWHFAQVAIELAKLADSEAAI